MKIAFADELWCRLYGPYGNRSVNRQLAALSEQWDSTVAKELYWEELHHQDDIYPATFAALPWLVELSPSRGEAFEETHLFLSHIIHCACTEGGTGSDGTGPRGKFRGLSIEISDHQHSWIPESDWLTFNDRPALISLEQWFSDNCATIAEECLGLVSSDKLVSAYALEGFATMHGSSKVAFTTQMFADGEDVDVIQQELGDYDEHDTKVVERLYPHIYKRSAELTSFMLSYPGCTFAPDVSGQEA